VDIKYQVIYSKRKRLGLTVERDGAVVVRAPEGTDQQTIQQLIESKKLWLYQKLNHPQKYSTSSKEFVSGETVLYLGKRYRLQVEQSEQTGIRFAGKFIVAAVTAEAANAAFKDWYRQQAKKKIPARVDQQAINLGVSYNRVMISELKYRWGSCTAKHNLNFNWKLIKAPMFVIDYVIVHELAHLLENNHSQRFWNIVQTQIPNFELAKIWLRDNGQILETEF